MRLRIDNHMISPASFLRLLFSIVNKNVSKYIQNCNNNVEIKFLCLNTEFRT